MLMHWVNLMVKHFFHPEAIETLLQILLFYND